VEGFKKVIRERRSTRRYLPDGVPEATVREILEEACWAPSWGNTQSTFIYVLSAAALEHFKAGLLERAVNKVPDKPDIEMPTTWPEPFESRMKSHIQAERAFVAEEESKRGIAQPDPPVPREVARAELLRAPHLVLVAIRDDVSQPYACYDAGLLSQNIALAAYARGLGTCIMAAAAHHPDLLREIIPESEDKLFVVGIALGYPDHEAAINQFPRHRIPLDERARFIAE
jgi:nitroreductase